MKLTKHSLSHTHVCHTYTQVSFLTLIITHTSRSSLTGGVPASSLSTVGGSGSGSGSFGPTISFSFETSSIPSNVSVARC